MTWEIAFMLILLVAVLACFLLEKLPTELTALSAFALLLVLGLLDPDDAMAVFANAGPIAVGAMFVISAALDKGGAIEAIASAFQRLPQLSLYAVLPILILSVALLSAFINNTPVVVVFLPIVISLAHRMKIPASKLLIPLSYASIFGGTCTLIGTSTNIIVSSVGEQAGLRPFSMFELAAVGLPMLLMGTIYLTLLGPKLLPARETITGILTEEERREYIIEAFVQENSQLDGKPLGETLLKHRGKVRVLEVLRHGVRLISPIQETILRSGDRLLLAMSPSAVSRTQQTEGIDLLAGLGDGLGEINRSEGLIVEGVLGPDSDLIGRAINEINFRQRYRLIPMAVHRSGMNLRKDFDRVQLQYGDTLLLLGTREALDQLKGNEDILILDKPPVVMSERRRRLPVTLAVIAGVIACASTGILPIASAAIIGCVILLLAKCLTTREAYEAIHWPILFLIFAMLGVGAAMQSTGTSGWLAQQLIDGISLFVAEPWKPLALLAGTYLLTTTLTEVLSNNAAAILIGGVAVSMANTLGVDPRPFLIAIAMAASASFATPIGYQTNTYVYGVGGYRFYDFVKIGLPLNIFAFITAMLVIPIFWSF